MATTLAAPDGTTLAVESRGSGVPIVFVHGSNGGLDSWTDIADQIVGYRSVRYARRNYAPSGMGISGSGFAAQASDLATVLTAVTEAAGAPAHVVGGSFGATVALHAAAAGVERIASLSLFEPPLLLSGPRLVPILDDYRSLCAATQFAEALMLFLREAAQIPADVLEGAEVAGSRDAAMAAGSDLEAMALDVTDTRRWSVIDVPVLLLQGELTWSPLPEGIVALAAALPSVRRVVFPGQSHFATVTAPELFVDAIQQFVDSLSSRR